MTYSLHRKNRRFQTGIGLAWVVLGSVGCFLEGGPRWVDYAWIAFGLIYLALSRLENRALHIGTDGLHYQSLRSRVIPFRELAEVRYVAGDYVFTSPKSEIRIGREAICPDQRSAFEADFEAIRSRLHEDFSEASDNAIVLS